MKSLCLCHRERARFVARDAGELDAIKRIRDARDRKRHAQPGDASVDCLSASKQATTPFAGEAGQESRAGVFFMLETPGPGAAVAIASPPGSYVGRSFGGGIEMRACDPFSPGRGSDAFGTAA